MARGEVEMVGSPSVDWLGVPLKTQGRAFGVLAVQSYDPAVRIVPYGQIVRWMQNPVGLDGTKGH